MRKVLEREEPLSEGSKLAELEELDSMGWVSIVGLFDALFSISVESGTIAALDTVRDLVEIASAHLVESAPDFKQAQASVLTVESRV
jgi:acyl carrier protein